MGPARAAGSTGPPSSSTRVVRRPRPAAELGRGALGQEVAVEDADPVAEPLGLVEVVGAHQDRPARVAEAGDDLADGLRGLGVEPAGRLVEVDDPRLVEQRPGDGDPLSHPLREAADPPVGGIGQAHDLEVSLDRRPQGGIGQAVQAPVVGQVLAGGQPVVEAGALGQDAGEGPDRGVVRAKLQVRDARRSRRSGAIRPARIRTVVVLPAPFGPRSPKTCPAGISNDRSCTATTVRNRRSRPSTEITSDRC